MELEREQENLSKEYQWVLSEEVENVVHDIQLILNETSKSFVSNVYPDQEGRGKAEKYLLSSANVTQQAKCMVTLLGDLIFEADLALKLQKQQMVPHQTRIYPESPWKVQQIQDTNNHLQLVMSLIDDRNESPKNKSAQQVLFFIDSIIDGVRRARDSLMLPRRRTLDELIKNPSLKCFKPALPGDAVVSFYVQSQKLVLAVYHLSTNQFNKTDIAARYQLEASVPWLNNALKLMTIILQKCQQLKDKITIFMQYDNELQANPLNKLCTTDLISTELDSNNSGRATATNKKSNNPFLDSPDDENQNTNPFMTNDSPQSKHEIFATGEASQVTWM